MRRSIRPTLAVTAILALTGAPVAFARPAVDAVPADPGAQSLASEQAATQAAAQTGARTQFRGHGAAVPASIHHAVPAVAQSPAASADTGSGVDWAWIALPLTLTLAAGGLGARKLTNRPLIPHRSRASA